MSMGDETLIGLLHAQNTPITHQRVIFCFCSVN